MTKKASCLLPVMVSWLIVSRWGQEVHPNEGCWQVSFWCCHYSFMFWITENAPNYSMYMYLSSAMKAAYVHWLCRNRVVLCFYSTRKYKVSVSNSSYSVLLQYKFTLLYCILLHGRSNGPHKEDWPDKRKRS